jgi:hypothetical protein
LELLQELLDKAGEWSRAKSSYYLTHIFPAKDLFFTENVKPMGKDSVGI